MADRAALVTGASSGIGLAISHALAEDGYAVTMSARRPDKLDAAVATLEAEGLEVASVPTNVTSEEELKALVEGHRSRYGRLDVLINNAGVGIGSAIDEIDTKRLDMQLDVNLRSYVIAMREAMPMLREAGAEHGKALIVNTASIAGKGGQGWLAVYSATKAGVIGLSQAAQMEVAQAGIQVTALCPGVRRHADDRVGPGPGRSRSDDQARGPRRDGPAAASHVAELPDPRGRLPAAGGPVGVRDLSP